jgi:shikimate dehydrogenase
MLVYDLVYVPAETPLMKAAKAAGARVLGGLPMLIYQGAASLKLWTGREAPIDIMLKAAGEALGLEAA